MPKYVFIINKVQRTKAKSPPLVFRENKRLISSVVQHFAKTHLEEILSPNLFAEGKPRPYFSNACIPTKSASLIVNAILKMVQANCPAHDGQDDHDDDQFPFEKAVDIYLSFLVRYHII